MRFSVVIPIYNAEIYLEECINSVLNQTIHDYEIILIDDGSTDMSSAICDRYACDNPGRIIVKHKKNQGLLAARQEGFSMARGDYCISVDADDFIAKDSLAELSSIIDEFQPDFVMYDLYLYSNEAITNINEKNFLKEKVLYTDMSVLKDALLDLTYCCWSMCAKCVKTVLVKNSYDFSLYYDILYGEDTLQTVVLLNNANTFVYTNHVIYLYRLNSGMTKQLPDKHIVDFSRVSEFMRMHCCQWCNDIDGTIDFWIARYLLNNISNIKRTSRNYLQFKEKIVKLRKVSPILEPYRIAKLNTRNKLDWKSLLIVFLFVHNQYYFIYFLFEIRRKRIELLQNK